MRDVCEGDKGAKQKSEGDGDSMGEDDAYCVCVCVCVCCCTHLLAQWGSLGPLVFSLGPGH